MSILRARIAATAMVSSLALATVVLVPWPSLSQAQDDPPQEPASVLPPVEPELPRFSQVDHEIRKGQALGSILPSYGVHQVDAVVQAAMPWVDLRSIWAGKQLQFTMDRLAEGAPRAVEMRYRLDEDRILVVDLSQDIPTASVDEVLYEAHPGTAVLTVNGSLWAAAIDAGLRPADIVRIAKVFRYDVDFNTELRAGAVFSVIGEELWSEGAYVKMGELEAVRLENNGTVLTAIHYVRPDGSDAWYHPDGLAAKKPFLRSPLDFSRVTSGFSTGRYHPVLGKKRKHSGTDFGAPVGTAVHATGDGVVTYAARNGGHGYHVVVKHAGGQLSKYSHLSKFKVKKGDSVKQGQVIALSGNTGLSTGPHLHYELHIGGKAVDAMKVELPNTETIPAAELAAFKVLSEQLVRQLDALGPEQDQDAPAVADGE